MTLLAVAVALTACLCVFNLVLTYAIIRRLREHGELLSKRPGLSDPDSVVHPAGTVVSPVRAVTVEGEAIVVGEAGRQTLVGFFTPRCPACIERLPEFVSLAAGMPGGAADVVAVTIGAPEETGDLRAGLAAVALVVNEQDGGPLGKALGVQGYPAFALLDSSTIVAGGFELNDFPVPATA